MAGYTPNHGPPGTEPKYVGSRNRDDRIRRASSPQRLTARQLIAKDSTLSLPPMPNPPNVATYPSRDGLLGTERNHLGSFNTERRARRAPIPLQLTHRELVDRSERVMPTSQPFITERTQIFSSDPNPIKIPAPESIDVSKTLKMVKKAQLWKKAFHEQLAAGNPGLSAHQLQEITSTSWKRYKPATKPKTLPAKAERRAEIYRHNQIQANPNFAQQREDRVTQLYNEVRFMNPKLPGYEVMKQARKLEHRETIATSQEDRRGRKRMRKAKRRAKKLVINTNATSQDVMESRKTRAAKNKAIRQGDQMAKSFSRMSLRLERPEADRPDEESDEEEYIPPSPPQIQSRLQPKIPAAEEYIIRLRKSICTPASQHQQGFAPLSPTQVQSRVDAALARLSAFRAEHATNAQKKSDAAMTKLSQMRADRATKVVKTNDAAMARFSQMRAEQAAKTKKIADKKTAKRIVAMPTKEMGLREEEEALRRERMYQTAVKSENMMRWLGQLTEDEPEVPEEMEVMGAVRVLKAGTKRVCMHGSMDLHE